MNFRIVGLVGAAALVGALRGIADGQEPAPVELKQAGKEFPELFARLSGVRELSNGTLIVADGQEHRIWLVNMAAGTRTIIGETGSGPLQYLSAWSVMRAGGETMVQDFKSHRLLILDANGKPARTRDIPPLTGDAFGPDNSLTSDDRGAVYLFSPPVVKGAGGLRAADGRAILRVRGEPPRVDSIAVIPAIRNDVQVHTDGSGGTSMAWGLANPFAPRDLWTVSGDGRVAVIHAAPYRIEWIADGVHFTGPVIRYPALPVTAADKADYAAKHNGSGGVSTGTPGTPANSGGTGGRDDWPATKPPFVFGAVSADLGGQVWIKRTSALGDAHEHYDVVGAQGTVLHRYDLPAGYRVVGFGRNVVYAARRTPADAEYLDVFRI